MIASNKEGYSANGRPVHWLKRPVGRIALLFATLLEVFFLPPVVDAQTSPDVSRILTSSYARSIAVDGSGNVFYVGTNSAASTYTPDGVYELVAVNGVVPSNPTVRTLASTTGSIANPQALALDSQGDVYVVDHSNDSIKELVAVNGSVPTNPTIRTLLTGVSFNDYLIAVDANGNLYFDTLTSSASEEVGELQELQAINGAIPDNPTPVAVYTTMLPSSSGVGARVGSPTTDAAGDVFFGDTGTFKELPATNGSITAGETPVSFQFPGQVGELTIAPNGTLYLEALSQNPDNTFTDTVEAIVPKDGVYTTTTPVVLYSAANYNSAIKATSLAADNNGDIFFANKASAAQNILQISPGGAASAPQATLTPATSDFGSRAVGTSSAAAVFTLANAGSAALNISSVTLAGANASNFSVGSNTCGTMLAAGASCTVSVTFSPTSAGSAVAMLNVVDAVGTQSSTLTGNGVAAAAPQAALSPSSEDFGSVTQGMSSAGSVFTLANAGSAALPITSVGLGGSNAPDFSITANNCGATLAANASCTLTVVFSPSSAGAASATLSVIDSVGTQTSTVTGTGVAVAPTADFGIAVSPQNQIVTTGGSATYTVNIDSSIDTFNQPVALTATGLPPGATVTFSPATVTPGASGATATMTITPSTTSAANGLLMIGYSSGAPLLAVLLCMPMRVRRRPLLPLAWLAIIGVFVGMQGCGGGFALPQAQSQIQAYTVTVTGTSGTTQHSATVQLSVQSASAT